MLFFVTLEMYISPLPGDSLSTSTNRGRWGVTEGRRKGWLILFSCQHPSTNGSSSWPQQWIPVCHFSNTSGTSLLSSFFLRNLVPSSIPSSELRFNNSNLFPWFLSQDSAQHMLGLPVVLATEEVQAKLCRDVFLNHENQPLILYFQFCILS